MIGWLIALVCVVLYSFIAYKVVPYATRHSYNWYVMNSYSSQSAQKHSISDGTLYAALWPVMLPWMVWSFHCGRTNPDAATGLFERRMARLERNEKDSKIKKLTKQNREMAKQLGLPTEEYE